MWKFAVLVVALLATPAMGQIAGTISVYTNRGDLVRNGNFKRWVREFEAIYPGTSVRVTLVERYGEEMAERFEKRSYGDVILVPTDMPKEAYPKFFLPLNDTGLSSKVYFANSWAYKEQEYAYTQGVSAEGLIYNKRVLGLAGETEPPLTVDQLYTLCEKIKANGKTPIFLNVGAGWPLQQWDKAVMQLSENGNYYESMLTQAAPFSAGQPYETSLGIVNKLFKSGYSEPDFIHDQWQSSKVAFAANEGGLFFLGSWAIPQLIEAGIASRDIGFVPFPVDNTEQAKGILNFDWGIAISRFSKNPQTAKAWLKFFLEQSDFADVSGFIPTVKSRQPGLAQLSEYMGYKPKVIQTASYNPGFLRLANKAGMDFMGGSYVRNILLSPDFDGSMAYWNKRWSQALANFQ